MKKGGTKDGSLAGKDGTKAREWSPSITRGLPSVACVISSVAFLIPWDSDTTLH